MENLQVATTSLEKDGCLLLKGATDLRPIEPSMEARYSQKGFEKTSEDDGSLDIESTLDSVARDVYLNRVIGATSEGTARLHASMLSLSSYSAAAKPTSFHTLINELSINGQLLRYYTQNVDGIENQLPNLWNQTVQLHGRIDQAICHLCRWTVAFSSVDFTSSALPDCPRCLEISCAREASGKRPLGIGRLRPGLLLYGEEHPEGDTIGKIARTDLQRKLEMLIVAGTRLRVPGARQLVKDFCRGVRSRKGLTVWICKDPVPSDLQSFFDVTILGDCDEVVSLLR